MKKVVIDCDPGIDDAMALLMAFASDEIDVLGITAVSGNVPVENTAENALALTELAGLDIEVASGACKPLSRSPHHAYHVHGDNGLGGVNLPAKGKLSSRTAVELLIDKINAHPGEVEIIALGPLTNIALLLKDYPEAADKIKKVIIMGGALKGGNATDFAEFNIYADPHAADIVFSSGVPVDMYGLDVTNRVLLSADEVKKLADMGGKVLTPLAKMLNFYLSFYKSVGFEGLGMHDPFTVACVIDPSLANMLDVAIRVECDDSVTLGQTMVIEGEPAHCRAAVEPDSEGFKNLFMDLMESFL